MEGSLVEKLIAETYKNIGRNIRLFRVIEQMTQEKLASKSNLTSGYISQIECADLNKGMTCTAMIKIAEALDLPPCLLMSQKHCQNYLECLEKITEKVVNN